MRAYEINGQQWRVDVAMPDGSAAQTVVRAQTKQQASELAKRYYRGKNLRVRVVAVEPELVSEYINKQVFRDGWRDTQSILGRYRLEAEVKNWVDKPRLYVKVYDDNATTLAGNKTTQEVGYAKFSPRGLFFKDLVADMIHVDGRYRKQGIATAIYKYVYSLGNSIKPSMAQLPDGKAMWQKFRARGGVEKLEEINAEDELSVSQQIQDYFTSRGYKYLGEGRDQIAFESPRGTVVKVVGIGEDEREKVVRDYVAYFQANQKNPYYPRIYNSGEFTLDGETYFVYEMEYLQYVANEEQTLDFLENLMWALSVGKTDDFLNKNLIPGELSDDEVYGLIQTTENLLQHLGQKINAPLDLHNVENLRRRANGHLVITDPFSL